MKENSRRVNGRFLIFLVSLLPILLSGCGTSEPTSGGTVTLVTPPDTRPTVLFRVAIGNDAQTELRGAEFETIFYRVADDPRRGLVFPTSPVWLPPSEAHFHDGWRHARIAPGNYFVEFSRIAQEDRTNPDVPLYPGFFITIPKNVPTLYGGTFVFKPTPGSRPGVFGPHKFDHYVALEVRDESDAARNIARELPAESREILTSLAKPPDDLYKVTAGITNKTLQAIEIAGRLGLNFHRQTYAPFPNDYPAIGDAGAAAGVLVGITVSSLWEIENWKPKDVAAVENSAREFQFEEHLVNAVRARLLTGSTDSTNPGTAFRLQLDPYRLAFSRISQWNKSVTLDVAVHLKLIDATTGDVVWEDYYAYGRHDGQAQHETLIAEGAEPHRLYNYKGDAGQKLFREELEKAVEELSLKIAERFKRAGF